MANRLAIIVGIISLFAAGCAESHPEPPSQNQLTYGGTHLLRQIKPVTKSSAEFSGGYFLFAGGISGSSSTEQLVTFAWQGNDGNYRFTSLPLEKLRVHIDAGCVLPYVRFRWDTYHYGSDEAIIYAVLGVNPRDWPESIKVPLQPGDGK